MTSQTREKIQKEGKKNKWKPHIFYDNSLAPRRRGGGGHHGTRNHILFCNCVKLLQLNIIS